MIEDLPANGHEKRPTLIETAQPAMKAAVVSPHVSTPRSRSARDKEAKLEEAVGLARAIDLDIRVAFTAPLRQITPATLIGKGVVERLRSEVEEQGIGLVVIDDKLTPVQQRCA